MIKDKEYFIFAQSLKFNNAEIKFNLNKIVSIKESHIKGIFLIINHIKNSTIFI